MGVGLLVGQACDACVPQEICEGLVQGTAATTLRICKWPVMQWRHGRARNEGRGGERTAYRYPRMEEEVYNGCLALYIGAAFSGRAMRTGRTVLRVPRCPSVSTVEDHRGWWEPDPRAMKGWSTIPQAPALGLEVPVSFRLEGSHLGDRRHPEPTDGKAKRPLQTTRQRRLVQRLAITVTAEDAADAAGAAEDAADAAASACR